MQDEDKSKEQLITELKALRQRVAESEKDPTERKRAEEALEESEARLKTAMDLAKLVQWEYDVKTGMFSFDEQFYALYGTTSQHEGGPQMTAQAYARRFIPPEESSVVAEAIAKTLATTDPNFTDQLEHRIIRADGEEGHIIVRWGVVCDQTGKVVKTRGANQDITDLKRAEEALLESENKFKSFAERAITGINIIQDGVFKYVNPKSAQMFGYTVEECLNDMPFKNLVYAEDLATVEEQVRRRLSGEAESIYYTFRGLKKNGQIFPLETYGSTIVYKGKPAATSTTIDITERKRAEAMLASVNRQNELLLNSVGDGIYGLDLEGRTTFVNPKAVNLVGYNLEEIIGRPQHDLIHHTKLDGSPYRREECRICAAFKDGQVHHVDTDVFWRKDGTSFPVAYTSTPIRDENGELQGAVVVFSDITERKRAEAEKIQMEQRLQKLEKAESLGRMAGSIAHHFNNKLAAVMGNLELALDDLPQESGTRASIVESMKASRMAAEVSRMMLAYLGQTTGRKEPVDLVETIRETLPILGASISQHVHLMTDFPPRRPIILGDNLHIKQILTNLVSNAAEAIDQNEGDITVAIQVTAAAEIQGLRFFPLEWEPKAEQYVCLSVTDTGSGMDVAAQEKVFDPFFSTKFTGRGLGLPVLLGLVRTHDGAITVMSSPGRGAMFRVFFPLHALEAVPPLKEEPLASRLVEAGGLALVVDDDPMVRNMVQIMLKRMAYEVIAAGDGYEAVEMFRARKDEINFVLLDLGMPGMDGWETLAQLRSLRPDIPVVLASGYDEAQLMQGDHPHRPQAFIHKPYLKSDLAAAIDTALKKAVSTG